MANRKEVLKALVCRANDPVVDCAGCPYNDPADHCRCDFQRICADALALLKEQEPRVLEYSEIEKHSLVWLEDNDKEDVLPALFLQYYGWNAEFSVHAPDKYVDKIFRFATVIEFEINYGITWRCWTSRPTEEQREREPWQ